MALRTVVTDEQSTLRKKARMVERFDARLAELAEDMLETMHHDNGIGLAANQIGILKRIFVMDLDDGAGPHVIINPEFLETSGEQFELEGCLSVPGLFGKVRRPQKVKIRYQDLQGEYHELEAEDLKAACICHESDHLDGVLFTDKVEGDLFRPSEADEED